MKSLNVFAALLLTAAVVAIQVQPLRACPMCSEAIASGSQTGDEEINEFPVAMNQSIYLMVSVPYVALGVFGLLIWRGCKKNAEYLESMQQPGTPHAGA
jgi:hypothetical protein